MDWSRIPLVPQVTEAARVVGEAEFVLDFEGRAGGWVKITVFEDLKAGEGDRFFARASFRDRPELQAVATASSPEAAATLCVREAGISLRRSS